MTFWEWTKENPGFFLIEMCIIVITILLLYLL
jgi:competence protein ComGC